LQARSAELHERFGVKSELYLSDALGTKVDLILKKSVHPEIRDAVLREAVPV
jgi:predicted nucleotidyltransferase